MRPYLEVGARRKGGTSNGYNEDFGITGLYMFAPCVPGLLSGNMGTEGRQ